MREDREAWGTSGTGWVLGFEGLAFRGLGFRAQVVFLTQVFAGSLWFLY